MSAFTTPASQPTNLFDRAHAAEQVIQELQALERDLQQIETPVAFTGLQDFSTETVQAFATWSSQVMDAIGDADFGYDRSSAGVAAVRPGRA